MTDNNQYTYYAHITMLAPNEGIIPAIASSEEEAKQIIVKMLTDAGCSNVAFIKITNNPDDLNPDNMNPTPDTPVTVN